ncbi:MAG: fumarylacetoacetate hydrolase family protein [Deltaproteobacteria bacterium]|nr:fumarylacetoacetate hydrolase family protein [Deltaproteobacteria bacterium]MBW2152192.1 fumarylacetoacetate hydrolase family protein [Deltaproteobacteria bacterium]
MKIAQYLENNRSRLGIVQEDKLYPLDFKGDMIQFIKSGKPAEPAENPLSLDSVKWQAPIANPSKIIAIGLNYRDHARESKGKIPEIPLLFAKLPSSIIGHNETISWNRNTTKKVDFEAELAIVIGKKTYECTESEALDAVYGYTCANDVSARDLQFADGQWVRGKSLDTFCPLGPWIVTRDELSDPHSLKIQCRLNTQLMQDSNTDQLIFKVPELVSFLSRHFTLMPGDIILSGTPSGVGAFRQPSVYMKDGDTVSVEIEGIGKLVNRCSER